MWILVSMSLAACSLYLVVWWVARPLSTPENVAFAEDGKPLLLQLGWPWIAAMAPICQSFLSWRVRLALQKMLGQGGAKPYWTPQHFCAAQCLVGMLAAASVVVALWGLVAASTLLLAAFGSALLVAAWPLQLLREHAQRRRRTILRELPFALDMITLCVEAGLNLHGAMKQAAENGPAGPMRDEMRHLLADLRTGIPRQEALNDWAQRCDLGPVYQFVAAIAQAERSGMNLGPVLRAQSEQWRSERFLMAEKLALEAPVKLMFPLIFCIFPCSFLIIAFPIAMQFMDMLD